MGCSLPTSTGAGFQKHQQYGRKGRAEAHVEPEKSPTHGIIFTARWLWPRPRKNWRVTNFRRQRKPQKGRTGTPLVFMLFDWKKKSKHGDIIDSCQSVVVPDIFWNGDQFWEVGKNSWCWLGFGKFKNGEPKSCQNFEMHLYVLGSKLPIFPYDRGWSSTQFRRGLYTNYKDSLLKVGWPSPIQGVDRPWPKKHQMFGSQSSI